MSCRMFLGFMSLMMVVSAFSSRRCAREGSTLHLQSKSQIILWNVFRMRHEKK